MDLKGLSVRELAQAAGVGRSRLHACLHREADKRVPLRVPETAAILAALDIDRFEAAYAKEILETVQGIQFDDLLRVTSMLCEMLKGLPEEIISLVQHVDGLGFDDVRPEHGKAARRLLVQAVTVEYTKLVERRHFRKTGLEAE
jgi:hypothetical protein